MREKQKYQILIVEDHPALRKQLVLVISKAGFTTAAVENGRKALELCEEKFFPILLTDWMMPEMSGLELCSAIRSSQPPGYVYIILLTAKSSKEDIVIGLEAGADDYLSKPFDTQELIARIKTGTRILDLENSLKRASEEIRILSITDPLTGCYNRAFLADKFPEEIKRARRYRRPLSVAICDIDHFKSINDTHGHQVGDELLNVFVRHLRDSIRSGVDWIARYGGDEFLIVLPETKVTGAHGMASRLCNDLSAKPIGVRDLKFHMTASFGISGFDRITPDKFISPDSLINTADECLYLSKSEGRNRVTARKLLKERLRLEWKTVET